MTSQPYTSTQGDLAMMNLGRARYVINLLLLAILVVAPGCVSKRAPISDTHMVKTPTIGVVLRATDPDVTLQIPGKGWLSNAGRGALKGTAIGKFGVYCDGGLIFCMPAFAIVGAIGGAIHGGVVAEPASEWDQAEAAFKNTLSDLNVQELVPRSIVEVARGQTPYRVIRVESEGRSSKEENAAYRALASQGIDVVLELTDLTIALRANRAVVNPPPHLVYGYAGARDPDLGWRPYRQPCHYRPYLLERQVCRASTGGLDRLECTSISGRSHPGGPPSRATSRHRTLCRSRMKERIAHALTSVHRRRYQTRAEIFDDIERWHNPRQRWRLERQRQGEQLLTQLCVETG